MGCATSLIAAKTNLDCCQTSTNTPLPVVKMKRGKVE
jgi:hypothetical protein